ncbi:MAG: 5-oxoprolinase subunit PxpA [Nibricoccus sp.]
MTLSIDLNCDLGEGAGQDAFLMPLISSANIACGGHAGDEPTMKETVRLAKLASVCIGAHPGFEDRENFGRLDIALPPEEIYALVVRQVSALKKIADASGTSLTHVKPHGALYNMAARNPLIAKSVAEAVRASGEQLMLFGLAGSELVTAGINAGLRVAREVFADRMYQADGSLVPRSQPGALHHDDDKMVGQVLDMVKRGVVKTRDGVEIAVQADTICLHGDGPHAVHFAKTLRQALKDAGVEVKSCSG